MLDFLHIHHIYIFQKGDSSEGSHKHVRKQELGGEGARMRVKNVPLRAVLSPWVKAALFEIAPDNAREIGHRPIP